MLRRQLQGAPHPTLSRRERVRKRESSSYLSTVDCRLSTLSFPHRSPRKLQDVEGDGGDAELLLGVADHDHAKGTGDSDGARACLGDLFHASLIDAGAQLFLHPHSSAAGPTTETVLAGPRKLDAAQAGYGI